MRSFFINYTIGAPLGSLNPGINFLNGAKRLYSTHNVKSSLGEIDNNISIKFEWLRGIVDGEGNFTIKHDHGSFAFMFRIKLHKDDVKVLNFVQSILDIGHV